MKIKRASKTTSRILSAVFSTVMAVSLLAGIPINKMSETEAATQKDLTNPVYDGSKYVTTWSCVYFGRYPQSDVTGKQQEWIKWRVLKVDDSGNAYLMADSNLEVKRFNETYTEVLWKDSTLRSWLNGYGSDANVCGIDYSENNFLDTAFSEEEQNVIMPKPLNNDLGNVEGTGYEPSYDSSQKRYLQYPSLSYQDGTTDKIYLLRFNEALGSDYGFHRWSTFELEHPMRIRKNTPYVAAKLGGEEIGWWWMRTRGVTGNFAMCITDTGEDFQFGCCVDSDDVAVCPVLCLRNWKNNSDLWYYAGTVSSNGDESPVAAPAVPTTEEDSSSSEDNTSSENNTSSEQPTSTQTNASEDNTTENQSGNQTNPTSSENTGSATSSETPTDQTDGGTSALPTVGTTKTFSTGTYKVTTSTASKKEVTFTKPKSTTKTSVTIPASVKIDGKTYKVTAIADKAFKNNKKLKSVTVSKNVTKIGKEAFYGCTKLKKITIKSTVLKSVGKNAIKNIYKTATIKVPKKQLGKYKSLFTSKTGFKKTMKVKK